MKRDFIWITLLSLCIYLLTTSGHLYSPDEETMYEVTAAMLTRGAVDLPNDNSLPLIALHRGPTGLWYSHFGILPSLLAIPSYLLGQAIGGATPAGSMLSHLFVSLINAPITALTAGVLLLFVRRLGYSRSAAWATALIFAFASPALVYARTYFSEPLTALLLLVALERTWVFHKSGVWRAAAICGLACGLLLATRVATGAILPWLLLFLISKPALADPNKLVQPLQRLVALLPAKLHKLFATLLVYGIGFLPGLLCFVGYNLARGDLPWSTGYSSESWVFTTPLLRGLAGMFLQPERGLIFYALPVVLSLLGLWSFGRRQPALTLTILCLSLSYTLLHAGRTAWEGGAAWGPRYILALLPLWLLPLAALWDGLGSKRRALAVFSLPVAISLVVNLLGILVNFNTYYNDSALRERSLLFGQSSPIAAHWNLLNERFAAANYPNDHCSLEDGFYATEGGEGTLLPRRSGDYASLSCQTSSPSKLELLLDDRRPPDAPVGELSFAWDGHEIAGMQPGQQRLLTIFLPEGQNSFRLQSSTWNPAAIGFSERDDELGVALMSLNASHFDKTSLSLIDSTIEPLPSHAVKRWAWYYQPSNHHLLDIWWWYLPRTEIGVLGAWMYGLFVALVSVLSAVVAWRFRSS
jgi:hypothetical protein